MAGGGGGGGKESPVHQLGGPPSTLRCVAWSGGLAAAQTVSVDCYPFGRGAVAGGGGDGGVAGGGGGWAGCCAGWLIHSGADGTCAGKEC